MQKKTKAVSQAKKNVKKSNKKPVLAKAAVKKAPVKKMQVAKKRALTKKNKRSISLKKIVSLVLGVACLSILIVFAILYKQKTDSVLSTDANHFTVTEDQLAMFATLSYEDPSRAVYDTNLKSMQKSEDPSDNFTACKTTDGNLDAYDGSTIAEKKANCMRTDRTARANELNRRYMFKSDDLIGTVALSKILTGKASVDDTNAITEAGISNATFATDSAITDLVGNFTTNLGKVLQVFIATTATIENSQSYYFSNIADVDSAKFLDDWDLVDAYNVNSIPGWLPKNGIMSAQTYKRGNDIVIAYRGTDLTDIGDWLVNDGIGYGVLDDTLQDKAAKE